MKLKTKKKLEILLTLTVWRNGNTQDIKVTLQEQP